jgi:type VI secretion system protein VasD
MSKSRHYCGVFALAIMLLAGCGLSQKVSKGTESAWDAVIYPHIDQLQLRLISRTALNNDHRDIAFPTVVRVYQLKDRHALDQASYRRLLKEDNQELAAVLLAKRAFYLLPGRELSVQMPLHAEAQFIAVVGFFQFPDLSQNTWRLVLSRGELKANAARIIDLRENRLRLRPWRQ